MVFDLDGALVEPKMHAEGAKAVAQTIGNFLVEKRKELIAAVHQGHINAEGHENRGVLAANHAATDHREAPWNSIHLEKGVGVERVHIIKGNFRGAVRFRTGGNQDDVTMEAARSIRAGDRYGVRILKGGLAAQEFNLVKFEIFQDAPAFHLDHGSFVVHEIVDGEIFFERIIDTVESALLQAGKIEGRLAKCFARNGSGVDAASAYNLRHVRSPPRVCRSTPPERRPFHRPVRSR